MAACGTFETTSRFCYSLSPGLPPTWKDINPFTSNHCHIPDVTRSHYSREFGWYVFGRETCPSRGNIMSEVMNDNQNWLEIPASSPFSEGFPGGTCSVLINSSTALITGGIDKDILSFTSLLDLNTFTWTEVAPMITPRAGHGCVVDENNEVLIAGGFNGALLSSVHIYNPATDSWREEQELPGLMEHYKYPTILLWNQKPVLLEANSDRMWMRLENRSWELMPTTLGAEFLGSDVDTAALVPADLYQCP